MELKLELHGIRGANFLTKRFFVVCKCCISRTSYSASYYVIFIQNQKQLVLEVQYLHMIKILSTKKLFLFLFLQNGMVNKKYSRFQIGSMGTICKLPSYESLSHFPISYCVAYSCSIGASRVSALFCNSFSLSLPSTAQQPVPGLVLL